MDKQKNKILAAVVLAVGAVTGALVLQAQPEPGSTAANTRSWWAPGSGEQFPAELHYANPQGEVGVISQAPVSTEGHPFFEPLGTNGRACVTCHQPANAMSLSVETIQKRWADTQGSDPLFAMVDGSNCPNLKPEDPAAHSLLLENGLFRIGMPWPPASGIVPEISIEVVEDPTGCNLDATYGLNSATPTVSVFRRPRMSANLRYVTTSFSLSGRFDGKRGLPLAIDEKTGQRVGLPLMSDARHQTLESQARDAITGHMQGAGPFTEDMIAQIVDFESSLYVAQSADNVAGSFSASDTPRALGPAAMRDGDAIVAGFNYNNPVFFDFDSWKTSNNDIGADSADFRASVTRGYAIFFERPMWISDVSWFNSIGMGNPYKRACAICHSVHMTGSDISPGVMDIGVNNVATQVMGKPNLPVFKVTCSEDAPPHPYLGREILTTDPGRALITGKCIDVGSLVMQQMRGIAARAPYFSNGSAKNLAEVVEFYDLRFDMQMSDQEKADLVNFLSVL
jgi:hypothetical protein